jgi:opacity protein-like surface antigen
MSIYQKTLLAALAAVLMAGPAWAKTKEGDKEIGGYISISSTSASAEGQSVDVTTTTLYGSFGVFTTNQLQFGAALLQQTVSTEDADSGAQFLEGFVKFHFNPDTDTVPYVGAMLGTVTFYSGDESATGTTWGAMAGVKFFVSEDLSVNAEYNIRNFVIDIAGVEFTSTTGTALLGLSYYFR